MEPDLCVVYDRGWEVNGARAPLSLGRLCSPLGKTGVGARGVAALRRRRHIDEGLPQSSLKIPRNQNPTQLFYGSSPYFRACRAQAEGRPGFGLRVPPPYRSRKARPFHTSESLGTGFCDPFSPCRTPSVTGPRAPATTTLSPSADRKSRTRRPWPRTLGPTSWRCARAGGWTSRPLQTGSPAPLFGRPVLRVPWSGSSRREPPWSHPGPGAAGFCDARSPGGAAVEAKDPRALQACSPSPHTSAAASVSGVVQSRSSAGRAKGVTGPPATPTETHVGPISGTSALRPRPSSHLLEFQWLGPRLPPSPAPDSLRPLSGFRLKRAGTQGSPLSPWTRGSPRALSLFGLLGLGSLASQTPRESLDTEVPGP